MVEHKERVARKTGRIDGMDFRKTLISVGLKLRPLDLSGQEKVQMLAALTQHFFPEKEVEIRDGLGLNDLELQKAIETVDEDPILSATFDSIISEFGQRTPKAEIKYKNSWTQPTHKKGESRDRFLAVLQEHAQRFPGILVNLTAAGEAISVVRQRASQLWTELEHMEKIPEGVAKNPCRSHPPKKPSTEAQQESL